MAGWLASSSAARRLVNVDFKALRQLALRGDAARFNILENALAALLRDHASIPG